MACKVLFTVPKIFLMYRFIPLSLVFLLFGAWSLAQERIHIDHSCSYTDELEEQDIYGFASDDEAKRTLRRIMKYTGLPSNFTIKAANVPNAAAVVRGNERFILYNQYFMEQVKKSTYTDWSAVSILAHEIGHHLSGHTLDHVGSRPDKELEADKFSGFVLYKMGATLNEARAAMEKIGSDKGSYTHPAKSARLAAITNGWFAAKELAGDTKPVKRPIEQPKVDIPRIPSRTYKFTFEPYLGSVLKDRIQRFQRDGEMVKDVEMVSSDKWIILRDRNGYWYNGIPTGLVNKLNEFNKSGEEIKQVELGCDGSWIILRDRNGYWYKGIPNPMAKKLDQFNRDGEEIKQVELGCDGSWMILRDLNGYWYNGIPQEMADRLDQFNKDGEEIKQVELGQHGEWLILRGKNGYWYYDIPDPMIRRLEQLNRDNKTILRAILAPNGNWSLIHK